MATIGTFKKSGTGYTGAITTLSLQAKNVRIVPEENRTNDNAPSHRVFVGQVEIGAAWTKRSNDGRDYLGLKLDDPSFTAPDLRQPLRRRGRRGVQPHLVAPQRQARRLTGHDAPPGLPGGALACSEKFSGPRPRRTARRRASRPRQQAAGTSARCVGVDRRHGVRPQR